MTESLIQWLLEGDISIRYQAQRDLLGNLDPTLQGRIHQQGWGKQFLDLQQENGHWGLDWYRPKWNCTHYILLMFKYLQPIREIASIQRMIDLCLNNQKCPSGGFSFWGKLKTTDTCVNGMVLNYASYFCQPDERWNSVVDLLLKDQMPDGGWNCRHAHGAVHSSFHTTLSVLEGLWEYRQNGGSHRREELLSAENQALEFLLQHHLFLSHRSLQVVQPQMTLFAYPPHWKYDVLKALFHLAERSLPWDERMREAYDLLLSKRNADGSWNLQNRHPGAMPFHMEKVGKPSRWNTLRALRVLRALGGESI